MSAAGDVIQMSLNAKVTVEDLSNPVRFYGRIEDAILEMARTHSEPVVRDYENSLYRCIKEGTTTAPNVTASFLESVREVIATRFPEHAPVARTSPFTGRPVMQGGATRNEESTPQGPRGGAAPVTIPQGTFTIVNPGSDAYETIKIETITSEGSNFKGKTILSYLSGPDNSLDFQGFAFINPDGTIKIWSRFAGIDARWSKAAEVVIFGNRETRLGATEAYALRSSRCARCGHKLTVPESLHRGLGPECAGKLGW